MEDKVFYYFVKKENRFIRISSFECEINTNINSNLIQLTEKQVDFYLENPSASVYEVVNCRLNPIPEPVDPLVQAKSEKILEIEMYDMSDNVNGFYYNDMFMWLDRDTRACLKNTLDSLKTMGREELNIWYNELNITLKVEQAEYLLASLEVYATDCYNVTAQHKKDVMQIDNIEELENYNIRIGYPDMLRF